MVTSHSKLTNSCVILLIPIYRALKKYCDALLYQIRSALVNLFRHLETGRGLEVMWAEMQFDAPFAVLLLTLHNQCFE